MIETLKTLIAPGGRVRLSPYVQDAQFQILFGEMPDPSDRYGSMRRIIQKNDNSIEKIAGTYKEFARTGRNFTPDEYLSKDFLRLYLAYYFTTNVPKVQINLISLLESNYLKNDLVVVDIGVGSGTTAVAFLDFMLAWATTCQLYDLTFPINTVRLKFYDNSQICLNEARSVLQAYCNSIKRRSYEEDKNGIIALRNQIIQWVLSAEFILHDLNVMPIMNSGEGQSLLFASNILNELSKQGQHNLIDTIQTVPDGSIATIISAGDKSQCIELNRWKVKLLKNDESLKPIKPCVGKDLSEATPCDTCWNSRRESLHETPLFSSLRERVGDPRRTDEYTNNLLSWSYACIVKNELQTQVPYSMHKDTLSSVYLGSFKKNDDCVWVKSDLDPNITEINKSEYKELLQFCPLCLPHKGKKTLWAEKPSGYICKPLEHGSDVFMENVDIIEIDESGKWVIKLSKESIIKSDELLGANNHFLESYNSLEKEAVDEIAYRLFGFKKLWDFQHEILGRVLTGYSILGIAATGGGKSECYILPAMLFPGVTIVVSPLKALMQDQFDKRIDERYGLSNLATYVNGDIAFNEKQARLKRLELGYYKIAYFTPEQLQLPYVLNSLKRTDDNIGVVYIALDEAHCISQWGHDFRDSYLNLVERLKTLDINPVRIALTATASPEVRADLCEELILRNSSLESGGDVYVHSSNRPELNLIVRPVMTTANKVEDIVNHLEALLKHNEHNDKPGSAIVFMPTKGTNAEDTAWYMPKPTEPNDKGKLSAGVVNFASFLERTLQTRVTIYNSDLEYEQEVESMFVNSNKQLGDLSGRSRKTEQNNFIEGHSSIMVATKGFGMGIDKPNIRLIIHRTPTANLEAYAQEAGRAGRDGDIADVILYYSPDSVEDTPGIERSDKNIQDYFLSEKYIRRIDVIAMRSFLREVKRKVLKCLYFTSDEVIPFFDQLEVDGKFSWPNFEKRRSKGYESIEHKHILDTGYQYNKKKDYVGRILAVLYRIRPSIGDLQNVSLVDSVKATGALIVFSNNYDNISKEDLIDPVAIINSNAYFGELLRNKAVNEDQLRDWVHKCKSESTIAFAEFLGISLSGLERLFYDIKNSDGYFYSYKEGKGWVPKLINFKYIKAPLFGMAEGKNSLPAWRDYAGATTRATDAYLRASNANQKGQSRKKTEKGYEPTIDDWFGYREITKPKGWEVEPGSALSDPKLFDGYLDAFMDIHDRREINDRSAYRLLLTDYLGINEDGTLPVHYEKQLCLRAVMLGYLKTGEIVKGNCLSCIRCVPDGYFENDKVKRENVVERLSMELIDLLERVEVSDKKIISHKALNEIWDHALSMETQGRSLLAYIEGLVGRLITDNPEHKTAQFIRIDGMTKRLFTFHPQETCLRARELLKQARPKEFESIWQVVSRFDDLMPDYPNALAVKAIACAMMNKHANAKDLWLQVIDKCDDNDTIELKNEAHRMLAELFSENGPMQDEILYVYHSINAARTAKEFVDIVALYAAAKTSWSWSDILKELIFFIDERNQEIIAEKILKWWVKDYTFINKSRTVGELVTSIKEALDWISYTERDSLILKEFLVNQLNQSFSELLKSTKNELFIIVLQISLSHINQEVLTDKTYNHILKFLISANESELSILLCHLNSLNSSRYHDIEQLVLAELKLSQKNFISATEILEILLDDKKYPKILLLYVVNRLIDIYHADGYLPNAEKNYLMVSLLSKNCNDWMVIQPHISKLVDGWEIDRLRAEITNESMFSKWAMDILVIWLESLLTPIEKDSEKILHLLDEIITEKNIKSVKFIKALSFVKPNLLSKHKRFSTAYLDAIFKSEVIEKIAAKSRLKKSILGLWDSCSGEVVYINEIIEYLLCATTNGLIDDECAIKIKLPSLLFNYTYDDVFENITNEHRVYYCDQIKSGSKTIFDKYRPVHIKPFTRWLEWFKSILDCNEAYRNIINSSIKKLGDDSLCSGWAEYIEFIEMIRSNSLGKYIVHFDIIYDFILLTRDIESYGINRMGLLTKEQFYLLFELFRTKTKLHEKDVIIAILKCLLKKTNPNWLTPRSYYIEALIETGRLKEVASDSYNSGLTIGRKRIPVAKSLEEFKGVVRDIPDYESILENLADLYFQA